MTIYVGCPDAIGGEDGRLLLAGFYQELLGWPAYEMYGDSFLTTVPWSAEISERPKFRLGFNETGWSDVRPPRWPDPDYPQQAHLDILVPDGAYGQRVTARGAILLQDNGAHQIYADPAGHPFCLVRG